MGNNQGFLSVNLSKARDNSKWAVSWLAELTVTLLLSPLSSVCPSQKPPCADSKRPLCVPAPRPHVLPGCTHVTQQSGLSRRSVFFSKKKKQKTRRNSLAADEEEKNKHNIGESVSCHALEETNRAGEKIQDAHEKLPMQLGLDSKENG